MSGKEKDIKEILAERLWDRYVELTARLEKLEESEEPTELARTQWVGGEVIESEYEE